jgi:hypothetical protein
MLTCIANIELLTQLARGLIDKATRAALFTIQTLLLTEVRASTITRAWLEILRDKTIM